MKDQDKLIRLQAYFDGELPEREAREVAASLRTDPEAAALLREFDQTRDALNGLEQELKLPESREFFWSKIQREIQRQEARDSAPEMALSLGARLRRLLVPMTSLAMLAVLVLVSARQEDSRGSGIETIVADSGALTYHNFVTGTSVVWLSFPAESESPDVDDLEPF
jgi:anti-sigma factor RsiW